MLPYWVPLVDAVLNADEPNLYVFASVMDLDMSHRKAGLSQHLSALARAASRRPHLADWGDLLVMLLRCLDDHPDVLRRRCRRRTTRT